MLDSEEKGGDALNILSRLSNYNAITNLVCFSGLSAYSGKLNDLTIYIDTPFFYNLLGANSISNKESAEELMEILQKNGAKFAMFRHNYNEVCTNLDDVICNMIAVYPIGGWWKTRTNMQRYNSRDTPPEDIDMYNIVQTKIDAIVNVPVEVDIPINN